MGSCKLLLPSPPPPPPAVSGRRLGRKRYISPDILWITHLGRKVGRFASPAPVVSSPMEAAPDGSGMKVLFVEMGVGYHQNGQDITVAAMRACRDAISSNSIPAFRSDQAGSPNPLNRFLILRESSPPSHSEYLCLQTKPIDLFSRVVDGGLIRSNPVCLEAMGDKNDGCYVVNAAVNVGY